MSEAMVAQFWAPTSCPAKSAFLRLCKGLHNRKNYLFSGSDKGGERAATIYSLIETAKLNDVNPQAWLTHVLENIADHPVNKVSDFLPWHFQTQESQ